MLYYVLNRKNRSWCSMIKKIIKYLFLVAIPTIAAYLAEDDSVIQYLIRKQILYQDFNCDTFQHICALISIIFTVFVLFPQLLCLEYKREKEQEQIVGLYNMIKDIATAALEKYFTKHAAFQFNMRIFIPEHLRLRRIQKLLDPRTPLFFHNKNIEPFAKRDKTEQLRFRVTPDPQGIVGNCYTTKSISYDENLLESNSTKYNLDQNQIALTNDLKWSICIPIADKGNNVIAVVAFDSTTSPLNIHANEKDICRMTNNIAIQLHNYVPNLFK